MQDHIDLDKDISGQIKEMVEQIREEKLRTVASLGKEVSKLRDEAVKGRKQSGVEEIWKEDREYYEGIDDLNRNDASRWTKPATANGVVELRSTTKTSGNCTAFFNITRQFVDSGAARMGDILLPAGDWNFTIKPSPIPEDADSLMGGVDQEQYKKEFEDKSDRAEERLKDWLVECRYHTEVRKVIEDSACIGTGILKGPVPVMSTLKKVVYGELRIIKETAPASFRVKPENFYPDPSCGENIHNGAYCFEKDSITAKMLIDLKEDPEYLSDSIDLVLDEGPNHNNYNDGVHNGKTTSYSDNYEIWYFYGSLKQSELDAMDCDCGNEDDDDEEDTNKLIAAVVVMVNDTPIKAFLNPIDSGEFPFDIMSWQRKEGSPFGIGIARQGRTPQDMLNASARMMMENGGLSGKPQLIIRDRAIYPADGNWTLTAGKIWRVTEDADVKSAADAIMAINIPTMQGELQAIIDLAYKMMEDATGIFYIMQGQQGSAPDTVGGMEILQRNSSTVLRRLARVFDESVTEPHIQRYYDFLLTHGKEEEKGDMQIEAIGSTALVEREIHAMQAQAMLQVSINPAFGLDPEKAIEEVLKSQRFNPDKWKMSAEKKEELSQQPPPPIPQVEVAHIRSETDLKKTDMNNQVKIAAIQKDMDRDNVYAQGIAERDRATMSMKMQELGLRRELALLDYANKHEISLSRVKASLSETVMKLNVQKELSTQVLTPPTEPLGRAPDGEAYQK